MQLIENILYIEFADFLNAGWKNQAVKMANHRNGGNWQMIQNPKDKRKPLVQYDSLKDEHKNKLTVRFGNVYEWVIKEPIKYLLKPNPLAEQFYMAHRYSDNKTLPIKRIKQYTRASQWLTMLNDVSTDIKIIKKQLGINIPTLYKHVTDIMDAEKRNGTIETYQGNEQLPNDFGTSYKRLLEKQKAFAENSYASIIDKMYGNQLAAKIDDEISEARLLTFIEDERQFDDVAVCMFYNIWANENGYKKITAQTVGTWRRKKEATISIGRFGNSAFNEKYIREVKGFINTSHPLALVEHDDNNLDVLFADKEGYQFNKYVAIVVRCSNTGLVLGKSYRMAQSPVKEMVHHAYLDAMYYIRSLTGGWYLPFEIKSDRWAGKGLEPFYDSVAKFVKPAKGNKHRGYIEQSFASPLWKRALKLASDNNYTGNNMTAKNRGVNPDMLERRVQQKLGPSIGEEAEVLIENFFMLLREMPDFKREEMDAPSKKAKFLAAWEQLPLEKKRPITDEQFLLIFGIKHAPQSRTITITNRGVEPQIGNTKYSYDLPQTWMYGEDGIIGSSVNVYYDPYDMSRVLVTDDKNIRFIAQTAQLAPRALADAYTGSRTFLNAVLAEKKDQVVQVSNSSAKRKQLMPSKINAEAMLQSGVMIKELKNMAEQRMLENDFAKEYEDFLDTNNDLEKYIS